jgi:Na+-transporting NADH:ubiquinone oxidoreductase subunit NqrC
MGPKTISNLYAYVAKDKDGDEIITGLYTNHGFMPLIGTTVDRMQIIKGYMDRDKHLSQRPVELVEFKRTKK